MKKFISISVLLCTISILYGQRDEKSEKRYSTRDFVTIKIQAGYTIHGTQSITLQREGLIYWINPFLADYLPKEERKETAKFIPYSDLDASKIYEIIRYLHEEKLYEIDSLPDKYTYYDSTNQTLIEIEEFSTSMPTVLTFIAHKQFLCTGFYYKVCNKKVDKFIQMMNELIPEEDRELFGIGLRCYDNIPW